MYQSKQLYRRVTLSALSTAVWVNVRGSLWCHTLDSILIVVYSENHAYPHAQSLFYACRSMGTPLAPKHTPLQHDCLPQEGLPCRSFPCSVHGVLQQLIILEESPHCRLTSTRMRSRYVLLVQHLHCGRGLTPWVFDERGVRNRGLQSWYTYQWW